MRKKAEQGTLVFMRWGGKRKGAGRKPKGERAGVSHGPRARITKNHPGLVTLRLRAGLPSLRESAVLALVELARVKSVRADFRVVHFSIQMNHLHLVVEADDNLALSRGMRSFLACLVQRLNRMWRRKGKVFADRYHLHVVKEPREMRNGLVYVLNNARKHGCWTGERPDPHSSGESFLGWLEPRESWERGRNAQSSSRPKPRRRPGMNSIDWYELATGCTPADRERERVRALLAARSWLLREGWRLHGLIRVTEAPASTGASPRKTPHPKRQAR